MHSNPFRVGLTGGIGSGKSTVCEIFANLGIPILDADVISRELVQKGQPSLAKISSAFGKQVINQQGDLDRKTMRALIFNDAEKKRQLEEILHPAIYQELLNRSKKTHSDYCILAIPLLIETQGQDYIDRVLLIDSSEENQLKRATQRDETTTEAIRNIIQQQASREERQKIADDIINNDFDLAELKTQVEALHEKYLQLSRLSSTD